MAGVLSRFSLAAAAEKKKKTAQTTKTLKKALLLGCQFGKSGV